MAYDGEKLLLFHELKSIKSLFLQELSYKIKENHKTDGIKYTELRKYFDECFSGKTDVEKAYLDKVFMLMIEQSDDTKDGGRINLLQNIPDSSRYKLNIQVHNHRINTIPFLLTIYEKRYLKTLLMHEAFRKIASEKLLNALELQLQDVEPFAWERLIMHRGRWSDCEQITDNEADNIVELMGIIEDKKVLCCKYHTENIEKFYAYKIMVSPFTGKIHLLAQPENQDCIVFMNVSDISNISSERFHEYDDKHYYELLQKEKASKPLIIEVKDPKNRINGVDRTFMLFSNHRKKAKYDSNAQTHRIEMEYYNFEKDEIIRKMLQLGHVATLIEPQDIKDKINAEIIKCCKNYI